MRDWIKRQWWMRPIEDGEQNPITVEVGRIAWRWIFVVALVYAVPNAAHLLLRLALAGWRSGATGY